jgi:hypothetical protein
MPDENAPLTAAAVQQMIADALKPVAEGIGNLTRTLNADAGMRRVESARERFIRRYAADMRHAYANQLPNTENEGELAKAEQQLRKEWKEDLKNAGYVPPKIGGSPGGSGVSPSAFIPDAPSLSPTDLIEKGLREQREGRNPPQA